MVVSGCRMVPLRRHHRQESWHELPFAGAWDVHEDPPWLEVGHGNIPAASTRQEFGS